MNAIMNKPEESDQELDEIDQRLGDLWGMSDAERDRAGRVFDAFVLGAFGIAAVVVVLVWCLSSLK